jgi:hypothetical protein
MTASPGKRTLSTEGRAGTTNTNAEGDDEMGEDAHDGGSRNDQNSSAKNNDRDSSNSHSGNNEDGQKDNTSAGNDEDSPNRDQCSPLIVQYIVLNSPVLKW